VTHKKRNVAVFAFFALSAFFCTRINGVKVDNSSKKDVPVSTETPKAFSWLDNYDSKTSAQIAKTTAVFFPCVFMGCCGARLAYQGIKEPSARKFLTGTSLSLGSIFAFLKISDRTWKPEQ